MDPELRAYLEGIRQGMETLGKRMEAVEAHLEKVEERLDAVEVRLGAVEERLDAVEVRLGAVEERLDALSQRVTALEDHASGVDARLAGFDERLAQAEEVGRHQGIRLDGIERELAVVAEGHGLLLQSIADHTDTLRREINTLGALLRGWNKMGVEEREGLRRRLDVLERRVGVR